MNSTVQCQRVLDAVAEEFERTGWETVCVNALRLADPESLEPVSSEWVREGMIPFFCRFIFGSPPAPVSTVHEISP